MACNCPNLKITHTLSSGNQTQNFDNEYSYGTVTVEILNPSVGDVLNGSILVDYGTTTQTYVLSNTGLPNTYGSVQVDDMDTAVEIYFIGNVGECNYYLPISETLSNNYQCEGQTIGIGGDTGDPIWWQICEANTTISCEECPCPSIDLSLFANYSYDDLPEPQYSGILTANITSGVFVGGISGTTITTYIDGSELETQFVISQNNPRVSTTQILNIGNITTILVNVNIGQCTITRELTLDDIGWICNSVSNSGTITVECNGGISLSCEDFDVYGCTYEGAPNYDPQATIDDGSCDAIYGCTDPNSYNYNAEAEIDDGSCAPFVYGCTNPLASNYNPLANTDDGSCNLIPNDPQILGCTNPLASNYNQFATFNDGTCIFLSGCTNPMATNYNPQAVVDDGTCECGGMDVIININNYSSYTLSLDYGDCEYVVEYDYRLKVNCDDLIAFFDKIPSRTVSGLLGKMTTSTKITSNTDVYEEIDYTFDVSGSTYNIIFDGTHCDTLFEMLSIELGLDCAEDIEKKLSDVWLHSTTRIPVLFNEKEVSIHLKTNNIPFKHSLLIDNFKIYRVCRSIKTECVIVPLPFGFDMEYVVDNKKTTKNIQKNIINTKKIDLRVDPINYIEKDLFDYFSKNQNLLPKIFKGLDYDNFKSRMSSPFSLLTMCGYFYRQRAYDLYLNSLDFCSTHSKELKYDFMLKVQDKVGDAWLELIEKFVPSTAIWNKASRNISNLVFHHPKFRYKRGNMVINGDSVCVYGNCNIVYDKLCNTDKPKAFLSKIDVQMLESENACLNSATFGTVNFEFTPYGSGRLLSINKNNKSIISSKFYPKQDYYNC